MSKHGQPCNKQAPLVHTQSKAWVLLGPFSVHLLAAWLLLFVPDLSSRSLKLTSLECFSFLLVFP